MLSEDAVLNEFREAGALLEGHFILSSGFHSTAYLQCARVLMEPRRAERLCESLAEKIRAEGITADLVVSPAMGGVVVGYEMGRQLGLPAIFFERVDGAFTLRRGFRIETGQRCLLVEDVVTTGLSSRECMEAVRALGGHIVAAAALVDRSGGSASFSVPFIPLIRLDIPHFPPDQLPCFYSWHSAYQTGKPGLEDLGAAALMEP